MNVENPYKELFPETRWLPLRKRFRIAPVCLFGLLTSKSVNYCLPICHLSVVVSLAQLAVRDTVGEAPWLPELVVVVLSVVVWWWWCCVGQGGGDGGQGGGVVVVVRVVVIRVVLWW